jgi:hypothetical protein
MLLRVGLTKRKEVEAGKDIYSCVKIETKFSQEGSSALLNIKIRKRKRTQSAKRIFCIIAISKG